MNIETLDDLFVHQLIKTYSVETALVDTLETLSGDVSEDALDDLSDESLREQFGEALDEHREQTENHAERLESVFEAVGKQPSTRETPTLDALVQEKEQFNNVVLNDEFRPPYYAEFALTTERLEITAYEVLVELAEALELEGDVVDALRSNLEEEQKMLERIQSIAQDSAMQDLLANADRR